MTHSSDPLKSLAKDIILAALLDGSRARVKSLQQEMDTLEPHERDFVVRLVQRAQDQLAEIAWEGETETKYLEKETINRVVDYQSKEILMEGTPVKMTGVELQKFGFVPKHVSWAPVFWSLSILVSLFTMAWMVSR